MGLVPVRLRIIGILSAAFLLGDPGAFAKDRFEPGHLLVKFKDDQTDEQAKNSLAVIHAFSKGKIGNGKLGQLHHVKLPKGLSEEAAIAELQQNPAVEFAELNQIASANGFPNDPKYSNEWHLPDISAPSAWTISTGSSNLKIAILDSGVDSTHPDLAPNMIAGYNFVDNNTNTADVQGHGTAVAGSAVAASNNAVGIASVCWSCRILPVRIAFNNGGNAYAYWSTVATGMQWAADQGAKIENISYVGLAGSSTILTAAQYVHNHGGLVFACAGNDNVDPGFQQNSNLIIVSGTDVGGIKASFSDYGNFVTLSAPANNILTTMNGGGYGYWWGTSFASPIAAAVGALVWSANPSLSNDQVRNILVQSADDLGASGWDPIFGYGKVNAGRAVAQAAPPPAPDTIAPSVSITSPASGAKVASGTVSVTVAASDNTKVVKVALYVDGVLISTSTASPFTNSWNTKRASTGAHTLQAKAYDAAGNVGTSAAITVYK